AEVIAFPTGPKAAQAPGPAAYADHLSFMRKLSRSERKQRGIGIDMWDVTPTGDLDSDGRLGRQFARELLAYIVANPSYGNLCLFQWTVCAIHDKAREEGRELNTVELGFMKSFGNHAVVAAA